MFYYHTEYTQENNERSCGFVTYSSYVIAKNKDEALEKIKKRNIGETLQSHPLSLDGKKLINVVELFDKEQYKSCLHAAVFITFVLTSANIINASKLLSDVGVVHELVHIVTNVEPGLLIKDIRNKLIELQQLFDEITHEVVGNY